MTPGLLLAIHGISALAQVLAAGIALRQMAAVAGHYRLAWGAVSLALVLMFERRIAPLWRTLSGDEVSNLADAIFGLAISLLMVAGMIGIRRLFTDMRRQERQLDALARTDALTGLPNRREILERLGREIERGERAGHPVAVLMFDIDHFKQVNDTWGHAVGDRVLQAVAETAQDSLRRIDSCGRIGGEEFLVLLPETGEADAQAAAERLRAAIAQRPITHAGQPLRVTVSIGVAVRPLGGAPLDTDMLIHNADQALYIAKEAGRDRVAMLSN